MSKEPSDTIALDSIYHCRWVRVLEELGGRGGAGKCHGSRVAARNCASLELGLG